MRERAQHRERDVRALQRLAREPAVGGARGAQEGLHAVQHREDVREVGGGSGRRGVGVRHGVDGVQKRLQESRVRRGRRALHQPRDSGAQRGHAATEGGQCGGVGEARDAAGELQRGREVRRGRAALRQGLGVVQQPQQRRGAVGGARGREARDSVGGVGRDAVRGRGLDCGADGDGGGAEVRPGLGAVRVAHVHTERGDDGGVAGGRERGGAHRRRG